MPNAQFLQHPFKRMPLQVLLGGKLRTVVTQDLLKLELVTAIEQIDYPQGGEHDRQALDVRHHLRPSQARAIVHQTHQIVAWLPGKQVPTQIDSLYAPFRLPFT